MLRRNILVDAVSEVEHMPFALTKTGEWRVVTPKWLQDKCKQCVLCAPFCPDSSIPVRDGRRTDFDYDHCKGCGICAQVCPFSAIEWK